MSQNGYTPIQLYYSTTASAVPVNTNLANGELAINITDGKLYYKDNGGTVRLLASNATSTPVTTFSAGATGLTPSTATSGAVTLAGTLAVTNGGTGLTTLTSGYIPYGNGTGALGSSANHTFNGTVLTLGNAGVSALFQGDFSNATISSRTAFQTGTTNGTTGIYALPNGASTAASWQATNAADPTNASKVLIATNGSTDVQLVSGRNGSGTYLPLSFYTNGSQQAQLDTSGNLGLGVTPTAGVGDTRHIELPDGGVFRVQGAGGDLGANYYYDSAYKYITSAAAVRMQMSAGAFKWYNAPSGTAGTAISFTQAMTLDASGNLGVGTTSPANRLHIYSSSAIPARFQSTSTVSVIEFADSTTSNAPYLGSFGNALYFGTSSSERARIDSSGNLLVGTTSGSSKVTIVSTTNPSLTLPNIAETATVSATASTGTINYDVTTQSVLYYTSNASGNFTMNIRGNSGLSLNSMMSTGQSVTIVFLNTNGGTAYYNNAVTIDGTSVTPKWQGGTAPSSGNASSTDVYTYTVIKTASATYTVLASQTKFA